MSARAPSIVRFYGVLLHLYPSSYRREHQHEMRRTFAEQTAHYSGAIGWMFAAFAAAADVIPNALAVHADLTARDVRQALRAMRRAPMLFGGALFVLAIGIGANGAVFSILQAVLLQPLPYKEPERVGVLWQTYAPHTIDSLAKSEGFSHVDIEQGLRRSVLTSKMVLGWRNEAKDVLTDIAAVESWQATLEPQFDLIVGDHSERLRGAYVTSNFFDVLGVSAALGRVFTPADEKQNNNTVVISYALWQRVFGGDSSIVGRPISLAAGIFTNRSRKTFVVAGVLPRTFHFVYPDETEAWTMRPWSEIAAEGRGLSFQAVTRVAPGISMKVAQARVALLESGLNRKQENPALNEIARLEPISDWIVRDARGAVLLLSGVSLLLFVITCTTVANALFIRVATRRRELAVRSALGAEHGRLVRQLFTEGALLAAMGALLGTIVASLVTPVLHTFVPIAFPRADEISSDRWVLMFAICSAALVVVLSAIAPAWRGSRVNLADVMKRTAGTAFSDKPTARWRTGVIGAQSAIATSLLVIAALLSASIWKLGHTSLGFDAEHVITFEMRELSARHREPGAMALLQVNLMERVRNTPGVLEAGLTSAVPFRGIDYSIHRGRVGDTLKVSGNNRLVDAGFFSVLHINLLSGRMFSDGDNATGLPVVILSRSYAKKLFGAQDPIGQQIEGKPQRTIVGIVEDVRYESLELDPMSAMYTPAAQSPSELFCIVAHTVGNVAPSLRRAVAEVDPDLPVLNLTTIDQIVSEKGATRRFYTTATIAFASLALVLTLAGLILIVARSVTERRHELAVRTALGATASILVQHVVGEGIAPVVAGAAIGTVAAFAGAGSLSQFLFQTSARSPLAYLAVAALILATGILAALFPALRATRAHPADVLRAE